MLGNQPSRTEKMYLRISPRKKIGIEIPISDASRLPWSKAEPYRFAARKPSGTPKTTAKIIAPSASSTVAGKRILISSVTGRKDLMLVPRLRCTTVSSRYRQYWT